MNIKGDLKNFILLFLVGLAAYWQIIFMEGALKWDSLAQYLPIRMVISESIRSGVLPFWNPYMLSGYPLHADPQMGAWYPFIWIWSLFGQYNLYALHFEFFFHVLGGCFGMYFLFKHVYKNTSGAFIAAVMYMLSGFFVGNAQHLTFIIAGCWTTWFFFYYLIFLENPSFKKVPAPAIMFFLMLTGAYPAFTIIASYFALALFGYFFISKFNKEKKQTISLLKYGTVLMLTVVGMGAVVLASQYFLGDYYTRSKILTWVQMNNGSLAPQCMLSMLFPLSSANGQEFYLTDISMSNLYAGVFFLVFLVLSFLRKISRSEKVLIALSIFFLLCAFGEYTPLRGWLGELPMLGWFRFPALFRFYVLLFSIPVIANTIVYAAGSSRIKPLVIITCSLLVIYISAIIFFINDLPAIGTAFSISNWLGFINGLTFNQSILLNGVVAVVILILFLGISYYFYLKDKRTWVNTTVLLLCIELIIAVQINAPVTVYNRVSVKNLQNRIERVLEKQKTIPDLIAANNYADSALKNINPIINNLGVYYKVPSVYGYLTFTLVGYEKYVDHPIFSKSVLNNWAYTSGDVKFYNDSIQSSQAKDASHQILFFTNEDKAIVNSYNLITDTTSKVTVNNFSAHKMSFTVQTKTNQMLTLMQQFYPGWRAIVNGVETKISVANYLHMSVHVKPGKSEVVFSYDNYEIKNWFYVSAIFFITTIVWLLVWNLKKVI